MGSLLGASGLYFLRRSGKDLESDLTFEALLPSLFWIAQGASFAFPAAQGFEAEFPEKVLRIKGVDQRAVLQRSRIGADCPRLRGRTEESGLVLDRPLRVRRKGEVADEGTLEDRFPSPSNIGGTRTVAPMRRPPDQTDLLLHSS